MFDPMIGLFKGMKQAQELMETDKYELCLVNHFYSIFRNNWKVELIGRNADESDTQYKERAIKIFDNYVNERRINKDNYKKKVIKTEYIK